MLRYLKKTLFGDQLNGLGTSWLGEESKIKKTNRYCFLNFSYFSDRYWDICKKHFWGPVEWVGDQLTGWRKSCKKQNLKINGYCFLIFFYLSHQYWDICRKHCLGTSWMGWRPVEWVGDQLTEWVKSCQEQNLKINGHFFDFFYFIDWYWNICKKHFWEPVEWVGDQLTGWRKSCQKQN